MCGIAGIVQIHGRPVSDLQRRLEVQSAALAHRGPDGSGIWMSPREDVGFCHRRLAIIDLTEQARQPMKASNDTVVTYNGEIYNYVELREALKKSMEVLFQLRHRVHSGVLCCTGARRNFAISGHVRIRALG